MSLPSLDRDIMLDRRASVGSGIRAARTKAGMTRVRTVAAMQAVGFSTWYATTLARVEGGSRRLRELEAVALAEIYGADVAALTAPQALSEDER